MLTFFCKRDKHGDCPGEWPVGESCGLDHDCSFDMRMMKCACECHAKKNEASVTPQRRSQPSARRAPSAASNRHK